MMAKTHLNFTLALSFTPIVINPTLITSFSSIELIAMSIGLVLGSLLPDIDEPNSTISRSSFFTLLFSWILLLSGNKHRGFTHKLIFPLIILIPTLLLWSFIPEGINFFLVALSFGIFTHQLGDMMVGGGKNRGGIYNYFSPFYTNNKTTKFLPKILRCKIYGIKERVYFILFVSYNLFAIYTVLPPLLNSILSGANNVQLF